MAKNKKYDDGLTIEDPIISDQEIYEDAKKEERVSPSAEMEAMAPKTKMGTIVNSVVVKIRKEPNLKSDILEILQKGDKIRIRKKLDNGFYEVSTSAHSIAFILSDFIEED